MKTTITLAAIALALSLSALATPAEAAKKKSILPPPEFDHPYVGTITVKRDSSASVPCRPRSLSTRLGCAFPPDKDGDECVIYLAEREDIKDAGYSENDLWRHEIAACNGWKGYRPIPGADDCDEKRIAKAR